LKILQQLLLNFATIEYKSRK